MAEHVGRTIANERVSYEVTWVMEPTIGAPVVVWLDGTLVPVERVEIRYASGTELSASVAVGYVRPLPPEVGYL